MHYLDNSATTKVLDAAAKKAFSVMTEDFGNPSSLHDLGIKSKFMLEDARAIVAKSLSAEASEIYFTSGGTEANNIAVLGAAAAKKRYGNKIVTTAAEHSSVINSMKKLENDGFEVVYIKPCRDGNIDPAQLQEAIDGKTVLVSLMHVNNETGAIYPVKAAAEAIKAKKAPALLHSDMVQSYGKLGISPKRLGVDLASVSGHKIHGPKGIGAVYISKKARILPHSYGGSQENSIRPGTEALPLIMAFAEAVKFSENKVQESLSHVKGLWEYMYERLSEIPDTVVNSPNDCLPYIMNFSAGRVMAQTMLNFLSKRGVYVSSGSACDLGKASHVLTAMELDKTLLDSALRASFSYDSTKEDIDALIDGLKEGLRTLAHK